MDQHPSRTSPPIGFPRHRALAPCAEASSPVGGAAGRGNRDHERGRLLRGGNRPLPPRCRVPDARGQCADLQPAFRPELHGADARQRRSLPYLLRQGGLRGCGQFHGAGGDRKRNRRGRADRGLHRQSARRAADEVGKGVRAHQPDHRFRMGPRTRRGIAPRTTAR